MRNSCAWKPGLTKTFRNRSGKIFGLWGSNLQNPSEGMLQVHIPDKGYSFAQADLSGAEALDVAMRTRPGGKYRQIFENNIKIHVFTAMYLFTELWDKETPYDAKHLCTLSIPSLAQNPEFKLLSKIIKKHDERYFIGKKSNHSFSYDKQAGSFRFDVLKESEGKVVMSLKQSEYYRAVWVQLFPEIFTEFHARAKKDLFETRTIYNSLGYPHYFGGHIWNDKTIREAIATGPQSTVGCIANIAACEFQDYVEECRVRWDLLNNKHDSLLIQAPDDEILQAARELSRCLSSVELTSPYGEKFRMKVEVKIGKNWNDFDEKENPEGLQEVDLAA